MSKVMTKQLYELTKRSVSSLRKADCVGTGATTVEQLRNLVQCAVLCIDVKRRERKRLKVRKPVYVTTPVRLMLQRGSFIARLVYESTGRPAHYTDPVFYKADKVEISFSSVLDKNVYAKSYGHPGYIYTLHVGVPAGPVIMYLDDFHNLICIHSESWTPDKITVQEVTCFSHRGYNITATHAFIATHGTFQCRSATAGGALKGVGRLAKNTPTDIYEDTMITKAMFKRLTGACKDGMESFQRTHNLPDRVPAKDLARIFMFRKVLGSERFMSIYHPYKTPDPNKVF